MLFLSILQRIRGHFVCGCEDRNAPEAERWFGAEEGFVEAAVGTRRNLTGLAL